jgi:hypothetical protein
MDFSRVLTAYRMAFAQAGRPGRVALPLVVDYSGSMSERPEPVRNTRFCGTLSQDARDSSAAQGLSGKCGLYLMERAEVEDSAREFAERFGNGY